MTSKLSVTEILFPTVRASLIRLFFAMPRRSFHVRELARRTELALSTIQQELHNLEALGILKSSSNGYHRFYSARSGHALFQPLSRIVHLDEKLPAISRTALYRFNRRRKRRPSPQTVTTAPI